MLFIHLLFNCPENMPQIQCIVKSNHDCKSGLFPALACLHHTHNSTTNFLLIFTFVFSFSTQNYGLPKLDWALKLKRDPY